MDRRTIPWSISRGLYSENKRSEKGQFENASHAFLCQWTENILKMDQRLNNHGN